MSEHENDPQTEPENEVPEPETGDEPEIGGEPEPDGNEPAPEPEEPAAQADDEQVSEKEIEQAFKKLGKLREHVANRVGDILGEDAQQLIPCPCCVDIAPGFIWPPSVAPLSPEAEAGTRMLLGMKAKGQFKEHPNAVLCEVCDGLGSVQTPSKVTGYDVVDCPNCNATGRILTSNVTPMQGVPASAALGVVTGPTVVTTTDDPPEAEALRAMGYQVFKIPEFTAPPANVG